MMPHKKSPEGYLSVTEVINLSIPKPFLQLWYGRHGTEICEKIKRDSQDLGIEVHRLIEERFIGNYSVVIGSQAEKMLNNFWNHFVIPFNVKPLKLEQTLKNKKLKLQGTFDAICETKDGLFICDWKTSNSLDKITIPLQLCAYAYLNGGEIQNGLAVRIDKEKDKVEVKEYKNLDKYWPIFKACMKVARYQKHGIEE